MIQLIAIGVVFATLITGAVWALDKFHDAIVAETRAAVHGEYRAAAHKLNFELGTLNTEEEQADAILSAALHKAVTAASKVKDECKATPAQAEALNAIRKAARR